MTEITHFLDTLDDLPVGRRAMFRGLPTETTEAERGARAPGRRIVRVAPDLLFVLNVGPHITLHPAAGGSVYLGEDLIVACRVLVPGDQLVVEGMSDDAVRSVVRRHGPNADPEVTVLRDGSVEVTVR